MEDTRLEQALSVSPDKDDAPQKYEVGQRKKLAAFESVAQLEQFKKAILAKDDVSSDSSSIS